MHASALNLSGCLKDALKCWTAAAGASAAGALQAALALAHISKSWVLGLDRERGWHSSAAAMCG